MSYRVVGHLGGSSGLSESVWSLWFAGCWLGPHDLGWPPSGQAVVTRARVGAQQQVVCLCSMWSSHPRNVSQGCCMRQSQGSKVQQDRASLSGPAVFTSVGCVCCFPAGHPTVGVGRGYPRLWIHGKGNKWGLSLHNLPRCGICP